MKRKKRFLSALLALSLVLTTLPAEALAAEPRGTTEGQIQRDIADGQTQTETNELPEGLSVSEEGIQVYADMIQHDLGNGAFLDFDSDSGTVIRCTPGEATEIQIPTEINGVSVVSIGDSAFWSCYGLTNITIPDGVTTIGNWTFNGCSSLTSITIPDGVTTIGNSTFRGCNSLTSITIPDSVTTIGDLAFYGCSSLTSITIPDGVTTIGDSTFYGCSSLTSITIPDSVASIGDSTFYGCSSLTSITIPDSVTTIEDSVFSGCSSLTNITIPDSVTTIGDSAFQGCSSLANITIPDSVTSIERNAFVACGLTEITIPNSVTSIEPSAFFGCIKLTRITISDSVTTIGDSMLSGCSSLTNITIPNGVTTIGDSAFYGCSSLTNITIPDSVTSIGRNAFTSSGLTSITIPGSVASIGDSAFNGCSSLTNITILDGVTSIGNELFEGCSELTNITIPDSVTSIGDSAFWECSKLTNITIPDSVTSIGSSAFVRCIELKSITIPGGVTTIRDSTFSECRSLTEITIPDSVTSIGSYAFVDCRSLTEITIPDSVTSIGSSMFLRCHKLTNITIPDSVTAIGENVFADCSSLTEIIIPSSVTSIGSSVFSGCSSLTNITIPDSVTTIGYEAFQGCSSLANITIPDSVTSIGGYAFSGCSSLTEIIIPNSVTSIEIGTFSRCPKLTSITIPDIVTTIGNSAFSECSGLTNIVLPDIVTTIGDSAFYGCSSLTDIIIPDSVDYIGNGAFHDCSNLTDIIIPDGIDYIREKTFWNCSSLTSITIPDSVTSIGWLALDGCPVTIYCFPGSYAETFALQQRIPYKYFKEDNRTLKVVLQDERGNSLTEGFSVTWYDADGNSLGTGKTLGNADPEETYTFEIQLDEELDARYEQPERQTIMPEDEAVCNVRLVLKPVIAMLKLAGRVFDKNGQPIGGAAVSIVAADSNLIEAATEEDGTFSAEVPYAVVYMTVQKDGYYSGRLMLDLSGETVDFYQADDFVLSEAITVSDQVTLDITQKAASENAEQALETPVVSAKALAFALTGNDGRSITDYEVQGTVLIFGSGAVSANETITVTVTDPAGIYTGSSAVVTLDGDRLGSAELTLTEKGSFLLGSLSGPEATLLVFDDGGSCIRTSKAQGGMSSGTLDAGKYRVVLLQKSSMLGGASNLDYLSTFGLKAGQDYLLRNITISDGKIIRLDDCTVPALDDSAMSYVIAENTSVTTNKSGDAALGEMVLVRAMYELDSTKGVSAGDLSIALPEGVVLADNSVVLIDGRQAAYTYDSAKREAKLSVAGRSSATVYLYCYAVSPGSHNVSVYLTLNNGAVQPIGTAAVRVETAKLNVVEQTGIAEGLTASGKTLPNSTVVLYDNDEEVGRTTSNGAGSWSMKFDLAQPVYSYSYHFVRAVTENSSLSEPIATEESMITYRQDSVGQVTKITMYNTSDRGTQETVFDFIEESTVKPYYRILSAKYLDFTFKVEFAGDASNLSDVYVVTANSAGDKTYIKTVYDAANNAWIGTYNYESINDVPVEVGAEYGSEYIGVVVDKQMLEDLEKSLISDQDEIFEQVSEAFSDNITFADLNLNDDGAEVTMAYTDPDTQEPIFSAHIQTEVSDIEEPLTAEELIQQGYTLLDEESNVWFREEVEVIPGEEEDEEDEIRITIIYISVNYVSGAPSPGPSVTPEPSDAPEPEVTPEPSDAPEPEVTPEPSDAPEPEVTPEPSNTPRPEATPGSSDSPRPEATPRPSDSPEPVTTPKPSNTPDPENPSNPDYGVQLKISAEISGRVADGFSLSPWIDYTGWVLTAIDLVKEGGSAALNDLEKLARLVKKFPDMLPFTIDEREVWEWKKNWKEWAKNYEKKWGNPLEIGQYILEIVDVVLDLTKKGAEWDSFLKGNVKTWNGVLEVAKKTLVQPQEYCSIPYYTRRQLEDRIKLLEENINSYQSEVKKNLDEILMDRLVVLFLSVTTETLMEKVCFNSGNAIAIGVALLIKIGMDFGGKEWYKQCNEGAAMSAILQGTEGIADQIGNIADEINKYCSKNPFSGRTNTPRKAGAYVLDPSGYVYEAVPSNRLEGVTAVISCEAENGSAWDAAAYDQVNPQITGTDGGYYWDVPQGKWKVSFTKDGYEATNTEEVAKAARYSDGWLPVPPPQLEINVGMISTATPAVKQTVAYTNRVEVEFSQYMDIDSVFSAMSLIQNDVSVSSCRIVPLNAEYNLENTVQYATRFAIVSDNSDLSDGLIVSVAGTAKNYAGTPIGEGYTSPLMTLSVRPTGITAPDKVSVILHEATDINVILQPGIENRELTVESLSPAIVTVGSEGAVTGKSGSAEISLTGILPGSGLIRICEPESGLSKTISVQVGAVKDIPSDITVEPVTAVLENGTTVTSGMTVSAGAKILLQTQTADAVIRYTLDDTCPCTDAALTYSTPITINDSTVLRAAAYKDGTYSTTIRLELHVETSGGDTPPLPEHTHNWAAAWASDMTHHWHECIVDGCTITNNSNKKDYSEHSYNSDTDTDCNICGFVRTVVTPSHTHSWDSAWHNDGTHHWHECIVSGCDITEDSGKNGYGTHIYDNDTDTSCNICGYICTVTMPSHTHSWDSAWHNDGTHHWNECTVSGCDITEDSGKNGYGTHIYDNDTDTSCNICGYIRTVTTPSHTHSWDSAWHNDGTHHWHECTVPGCDITENSGKNGYGTHIYDNDTDTSCNICGYIRTVTTPSHTHSWDSAWHNDGTYHWHECTVSGCDITADSGKNSYGAHVYDSDADTDCNICGFIRTVTAPSGQTYTITFNANGGTVDTYNIATGTDGKLSDLPAAVREGYTFKGWFTAEDGGVLITIDMEFTQNTTVYAHWQQNSSDEHTDSLTGDEATSTDSASPAEKRSYVDILVYGIGIMAIAAALVYYKKKKR